MWRRMTFDEAIVMGMRTMPLTFKPSVYYNEHGRMWSVCLANEPFYVRPHQTLTVETWVSDETGEIIGFDVWDKNLRVPTDQKNDD